MGISPRIEITDSCFLGTIKAGKKVLIPVKIKNQGKGNLIIRKIGSDCTCTTTLLGKRIIESRDSVILEISFNPMGRNGKQNKTIVIYSNDPRHSMLRLSIQGYVEN